MRSVPGPFALLPSISKWSPSGCKFLCRGVSVRQSLADCTPRLVAVCSLGECDLLFVMRAPPVPWKALCLLNC